MLAVPQLTIATELEGMARVQEVLSANEWASGEPTGLHDDGGALLADTDEPDDFDIGADELEREMLGLRMAIENGGDDDADLGHLEDDQLDGLLLRVQAIRGERRNLVVLHPEITRG